MSSVDSIILLENENKMLILDSSRQTIIILVSMCTSIWSISTINIQNFWVTYLCNPYPFLQTEFFFMLGNNDTLHMISTTSLMYNSISSFHVFNTYYGWNNHSNLLIQSTCSSFNTQQSSTDLDVSANPIKVQIYLWNTSHSLIIQLHLLNTNVLGSNQCTALLYEWLPFVSDANWVLPMDSDTFLIPIHTALFQYNVMNQSIQHVSGNILNKDDALFLSDGIGTVLSLVWKYI